MPNPKLKQIIDLIKSSEGVSIGALIDQMNKVIRDNNATRKDFEYLVDVFKKLRDVMITENNIDKTVSDSMVKHIETIESMLRSKLDTSEKKTVKELKEYIEDVKTELILKMPEIESLKESIGDIETKIEISQIIQDLEKTKKLSIKALKDFPEIKDHTEDIGEIRKSIAIVDSKIFKVPVGLEIFHNGRNFGRFPSINFIGGTFNASASRVDVSIGEGTGGGTWGSITGTLSNQTDLQNALNAKQDTLTFSTGLTRTSNTVTNDLSTGVSGGQTVYGGTGSGDNLVLRSTTNATRGNVKIDTTSGGFNFRDYFGSIPAMYPGSNVTAGSDAFILASFGTTSMFYGSGGAASLYHFVSGANRTVLTSTYYNIGVNTSIGLALGTTPSAKLHLESGTAELQTMGASILLNQKWLGVNTVGLRIYQTPDAGNRETGRVFMNFWNGSSATLGVTMEFATLQRSTLTLTTRMVIDNLGQVGIGTTSGVDATSKLEVRTNSLGTTQTTSSGLALTNTTAAAAGAQQISPAIRWSGKGWKTDATAASRDVDFRSYVVPVQGAANPTGYLTFESSINGAAYSEVARVTNTGVFTTTAGIISGGTIRLKGYTVATLPAGTVGDTAYVTDALAPAFLATVVGGGAVTTPVFFDGTNWVGY